MTSVLPKELIMSDIKKTKLSDSVPHENLGSSEAERHVKTLPGHATSAEQSREAQESKTAAEHQESTRDRMVDIGRGNQQSGRQGQ
jgi:hypothetical protein